MTDSGTTDEVQAPEPELKQSTDLANGEDETAIDEAQAKMDEAQAKADELAEQIQRQKDALHQLKATKVKDRRKKAKRSAEPEDGSAVGPENEKEEEENGVTEAEVGRDSNDNSDSVPEANSTNEENINDSVKSLAGSTTSTFDTDDEASVKASETKARKESESFPDHLAVNLEPSDEATPTPTEAMDAMAADGQSDFQARDDDVISASDINPVVEPTVEDLFENALSRPACSAPTEISDTDAQKLAETQANYMLPSAFNYKKGSEAGGSESDSDVEVVVNKTQCKCETIKKDNKVKTKVCTML